MPEEVPDVEILSVDLHDPRWIAIHYFDPNKGSQFAREIGIVEVAPNRVPKQVEEVMEAARELLAAAQVEIVNPPDLIRRREEPDG